MANSSALVPNGDLQQAESAGLANTSGPFIEHQAETEIPVIESTNEAADTVIVTFRDAGGREFSLSTPPFQTTSISVPAGDYEVSVRDDAGIHDPAFGDATFRRHKLYTAEWTTGYSRDRFHLGD